MKRFLFAAIIAAIGLLHAYPAAATDIDIPGFDQSSFTNATGSWLVSDIVAQPTGAEGAGTSYLVATLGLGEFSGHSNQIAILTETGWYFVTPSNGMKAFVQNGKKPYIYLDGWEPGGDGVGSGFGGVLDAKLCGVTSDGVTDDTVALNTCLQTARIDGIVEVWACGQTVVASGNLVMAAGVHLKLCGLLPGNRTSHDYRIASGLQGILAIPSTHTIDMSADGSALSDGTILRSDGPYAPTIYKPTTTRAGINVMRGFAGTAITLSGESVSLSRLQIMGFDKCIDVEGAKSIEWSHIYGDCTNGAVIDHSFNTTQIDDVKFTSFLTHAGLNLQKQDIENITGDGAGHYKLVVGIPIATFQFITGDEIYVGTAIGGGAQSAAGRQDIDCGGVGVNCAAIPSGTDGCTNSAGCQEFVLTDTICALASGTGCGPITATADTLENRGDGNTLAHLHSGSDVNDLAVGQAVTGTCIAADTLVKDVWEELNIVILDTATTCTTPSVTLSFTDDSFSHDGRGLEVSSVQRHGTCFNVTNAGGVTVSQLTCYTHDLEVHCGQNCNELRLTNAAFGENDPLSDDDITTVLIDGDHNGQDGMGFVCVNCVLGQHSVNDVIINSDQARCSRISNSGSGVGSGRKNGTILNLISGCVLFTGNAGQTKGNVFIADGWEYRIAFLNNNDPGTGYTDGDVLTTTGGTCSVPAKYTVDTVNSDGEILTGHQTQQGVCSVWPANPIVTTGGTGTGAELNTDGFINSTALFANNNNPQEDFYVQSYPSTAFSGVNNTCLAMAVCNSSGSVFVGGVLVGADRGGRMTAAAAMSPICGDVVPGSASVKTTVTMPASPPASCHISVSPGLQSVLVDFNGHVARAPCFGGHDISKLLMPFVIESSYIDFVFDGAQWGPSAASRLQYETMCPGDDQLLTNGQARFSWNSGSTRFELNQFGGPGGLIIHGQMHVIPSTGLFFGGAGTTSSALNYFYASECGAAVVSGAANNGSGLIRLTLDCVGGNTGDQVRLLCHSIGGTVEANGSWTGTIIDSTHIDLLSSTFANAFANVGSPLCRVTYISASTTGHHTFNGLETKSDDNNSTLIGMAYVAAAHAVNDSATLRDVASWYNRKTKTCINKYTADRTTTSTTYAEPNSEIECEFVTWGENDLAWSLSGAVKNNTNADGTAVSAGFDGTTAETEETAMLNLVASSLAMSPVSVRGSKTGLSEGKHYITLLAKAITGGTSTIYGTTPVTSAEISVPQ